MLERTSRRKVIYRPDEVELADPILGSTARRMVRFFSTMDPMDELRAPLCRWDGDGNMMGRNGIPEHQWVLDSIPTNGQTRVVLRRIALSGNVYSFQRIDDVLDISIVGDGFVVIGTKDGVLREVRFPILEDVPMVYEESASRKSHSKVKPKADPNVMHEVYVGPLLMGSFSSKTKAHAMARGFTVQGSKATVRTRRF